MLIAARNSFLMGGSSTPTARDYVQDGLIAMWDGIENAGWGVHDAEATTWKDLAGNNDLTVTQYGSWTADNALHSNGSGAGAIREGATISPNTVELLCMIPSAKNYAVILSMSTGGMANIATSSDSTRIGGNGGNTHWLPFDAGAVHSHVFIGGAQSFYDGILYNSSTMYTGVGGRANIAFGGRTLTNSPLKCYVYAARLYNRILTAGEIAHNYAIDKERFNLP